MVKHVRGTVRVSSVPGGGTTFQLQLPVTLSVLRAVLAEIGGEPYAFPLAFITRIVTLPRPRIDLLKDASTSSWTAAVSSRHAHQGVGNDRAFIER